MAVALPDDLPLVEEADIVPDFHNRVQVVGIHYRGNAQLLGKRTDKVVDNDGRFRVKSGIGLVTEQKGRIQGYGSCDSDPFLHSAGELVRVFVLAVLDIDLVQKISGTLFLLGLAPVCKEIHREHHVAEDGAEIEKGAALEKHSDLLVKHLLLLPVHPCHLPVTVPYLAGIRLDQAGNDVHQYRLAGAARPDEHIALPRLEIHIYIFQDRFLPETLPDILHSDHILFFSKSIIYDILPLSSRLSNLLLLSS